MAPNSSILAWKIPWAEEPGRLQSIRLQRVGHNGSDLVAAAAAAAANHVKQQDLTHEFLPVTIEVLTDSWS